MAKHTPTPWKVYSAPLRREYPTPIIEILDANDEPVVKWTGFDGVDYPKRKRLANARLMAAAPALAEACVAALPFLTEFAHAGNQHAPGTVRKLKAALRQAGFSAVVDGRGRKDG